VHARAAAALLPHARGGPAGLAYLLRLVGYSGRARDNVLVAGGGSRNQNM
jgi:hypothetical protein